MSYGDENSDIPDWLLQAGNAVGDYEIADVAGPPKTADEIERERSFSPIPEGIHELVVVGFLTGKDQNGPVKRESKEGYLVAPNGQVRRIGYDADSVVVRFAMVQDTTRQTTDYFLLPPADPAGLVAYYDGLPKPDSKATLKGFQSNKFVHFMERLGFAYPKGGSLPPEARRLRNWIGRKVVAEIVAGTPYHDQTTGEEKPGRNQVKLFSYRNANSTQAIYVRGGELAAAGKPVQRPQQRQTQAQSPPGLDNV